MDMLPATESLTQTSCFKVDGTILHSQRFLSSHSQKVTLCFCRLQISQTQFHPTSFVSPFSHALNQKHHIKPKHIDYLNPVTKGLQPQHQTDLSYPRRPVIAAHFQPNLLCFWCNHIGHRDTGGKKVPSQGVRDIQAAPWHLGALKPAHDHIIS